MKSQRAWISVVLVVAVLIAAFPVVATPVAACEGNCVSVTYVSDPSVGSVAPATGVSASDDPTDGGGGIAPSGGASAGSYYNYTGYRQAGYAYPLETRQWFGAASYQRGSVGALSAATRFAIRVGAGMPSAYYQGSKLLGYYVYFTEIVR